MCFLRTLVRKMGAGDEAMFDSVRLRLTLWYTGAMALILATLAASTYFVLRRNIVVRADTQATELADTFLSTFRAEVADSPLPGSLESFSEGIVTALAEHKFRDVIFVAFDSNGKLLGFSESAGKEEGAPGFSQPTLLGAVSSLRSSSRPFGTAFLARHRYRSYARQFSNDGRSGTLLVLQSLHDQNEFLEALAGTFSVAIPLLILLSSFGGYVLAGKSLSPVVAMSAQASRIGAENLHERLNVINPQDELGRLAASFNELLDRVDRSFEKQRKFVADASHELRTPVAILCGEADVTLQQDTRTESEYRESLEILRDEARRLKRIVEDLFTLARADAGQHPLELANFYLEELMAECTKNVRTLAAAKAIMLSCEFASELPIRGDEALLRRMVLNLLDNAIKYTMQGGKVLLRVGGENGSYRIEISDTGSGIPTDLQAKIFERFFRGDKARSRDNGDAGGAGLGLAISAWIAQAHGGKIELTRSTSRGSVFTVLLPKDPSDH